MITTFIIFSENTVLRVCHTLEDLEKIKKISVPWTKVEIWKNNQCQNIVASYHGFDELMEYAEFYYNLEVKQR